MSPPKKTPLTAEAKAAAAVKSAATRAARHTMGKKQKSGGEDTRSVPGEERNNLAGSSSFVQTIRKRLDHRSCETAHRRSPRDPLSGKAAGVW
jgi:hypothetical protein